MLTKRWKSLKYHPEQQRLWNSKARFKVVPSGRRSGKTEIEGKRKIIKIALQGPTANDDLRIGVGAPTRDQAKRIYWEDLKALIPKNFIKEKSESELVLTLVNNASISVVGLDRPERVEGTPWDHFVLDEYGNMKKTVWTEHLRPALSDRNGSCSFIGVPEGRNHYYDLYLAAKEKEDWDVFHWFSSDILSAKEIAAAKEDLDELTFKQEYEGSFVNFQGQVYYTFDREVHAKQPLRYFDERPLILCFDFNVSPGVAVIIQEQIFYNNVFGTGVIDEVWIERDSNTQKICEEIIKRYKNHYGKVVCYGDSTGGNRGSAKVQGSDWDLIKQYLRPVFRENLIFRVKKSNPRERERINSVNSRIKTQAGIISFMVDPKCKRTISDFEGTIYADDGTIDKKKDSMLTHLGDSIGYYIAYEFPISEKTKVTMR